MPKEQTIAALRSEIAILKTRIRHLVKTCKPCNKHSSNWNTVTQLARAAGVAPSTVYRHVGEYLLQHDAIIVKRGKPTLVFNDKTRQQYVEYVAKFRLPKKLGRQAKVAQYADEYGIDAAAERFGMKRRSVQMAVYRQNKARKIPEIITPAL